MSNSDKSVETTLIKWFEAKEKLKILEDKIEKYKLQISKEMNRIGTERITAGNYTVTRRRGTRSYLSKDNVPAQIWKEYSTQCGFDSYYLVKK